MDSPSPSAAVIEAVAARKGLEPSKLEPPLYEVVDPAALDRVVTDSPTGDSPPVCITFSYAGCEVVVDHDGSVRLAGPD